MTNSSYFRKTLHMLSLIEKYRVDEVEELDMDSEEHGKMLSALEQLGLVEKKRKEYVISKKGKNVLNYFKSNAGNYDKSPVIGRE